MALQGPSRESYASAVERLDAYAAGADTQRLTALGDEILAVAELLRSQPRLRRALVDPGRATEDRVALFEAIFAGKVDGDTLELLRELIRGRWSTAADLLEGTERFGVEALLAAGERAGELSEVEDELFRFGQVAAGDPRLGAILGDSTVDFGRRSRVYPKPRFGRSEFRHSG